MYSRLERLIANLEFCSTKKIAVLSFIVLIRFPNSLTIIGASPSEPQRNRLTYCLNLDGPIGAFIGDGAYDSITNFDLTVKELRGELIITENLRNKKPQNLKLSRRGYPCCIAGFKILSIGIDIKQNRLRHKFICPTRGSMKFGKHQPICL